jgi:hypothetical protein
MSISLNTRPTELGEEYTTPEGTKVADAIYRGFQHWELRFTEAYALNGLDAARDMSTLEACQFMSLAVYAHCRALNGMR